MVSLDLSGRNLRGGIFDAANNLIKFIDSPFHGLGPQAVETQIRALVKELVAEPSAHNLPLLGIGVSLPGAIDMQTGDIYDSYNLRLHHYPLRRILSAEFALPVYIEHDASVAALAERYYGAGRGLSHLVYVLVSTGIGSGILIDGQIYRGESGVSGELGHIILDPDGQMCVCGKLGCLEALAAEPAILASALGTSCATSWSMPARMIRLRASLGRHGAHVGDLPHRSGRTPSVAARPLRPVMPLPRSTGWDRMRLEFKNPHEMLVARVQDLLTYVAATWGEEAVLDSILETHQSIWGDRYVRWDQMTPYEKLVQVLQLPHVQLHGPGGVARPDRHGP